MEDKEAVIRRGEVYRQYHSDPVYREPWKAVRAELVARWQATEPQEHAVRENIYNLLDAMDKLDKFVAGVIMSGQVEKTNLEALVKRQKGIDTGAYH